MIQTHCWADMIDTPLFGAMQQLQFTHPLSHTHVWPVTEHEWLYWLVRYLSLAIVSTDVLQLVFKGDIYFTQCFRFCFKGQRLFKGSTWSRNCLFLPKHIDREVSDCISLPMCCNHSSLHHHLQSKTTPGSSEHTLSCTNPSPFPPTIVIPSWNTEKV